MKELNQKRASIVKNKYINALIIILLLPGLSWVGMFTGGRSYFLGSLVCVFLFYLLWVLILSSKKKHFFLKPSGKIFYRPLILRLVFTPVSEIVGGFLILPLGALPIILAFDNPDTYEESLASFILGFWLTFVMGLWLQIIYILFSFLLRKQNK